MKSLYMHKATRSIADLIPSITDAKTVILTRINVPNPHRRKGLGQILLNEILKDADEDGITVVLEPVGSGDMKTSQLVKWYERNGFVMMDIGLMVRTPIVPVPSMAFDKNLEIDRVADI